MTELILRSGSALLHSYTDSQARTHRCNMYTQIYIVGLSRENARSPTAHSYCHIHTDLRLTKRNLRLPKTQLKKMRMRNKSPDVPENEARKQPKR